MSDSEYDRKRKAGEIDSTAVAPKKKLAAQAAMAAAEAAGGSSSATVKLEAGKPSYSIDGQSVDWNGYRTAILGQIAQLNAILAASVGVYEEIGEATT